MQDAQAIEQIVAPEIELVSTLEKPEYVSVDLSKFLAAANPYPYVFSSAYLDETPHDAFNSSYAGVKLRDDFKKNAKISISTEG